MGEYLPQKVLTNADLEKMVDTSNEWIISRTGIKERRIASCDEATSDLAIKAAKKALANALLKPEDLELIIIATITPDMSFPSVASIVQNALISLLPAQVLFMPYPPRNNLLPAAPTRMHLLSARKNSLVLRIGRIGIPAFCSGMAQARVS